LAELGCASQTGSIKPLYRESEIDAQIAYQGVFIGVKWNDCRQRSYGKSSIFMLGGLCWAVFPKVGL